MIKKNVIIIIIFIFQTAFPQQIIYVSNKGKDENNGTKQFPVYTLQSAFNLAKEINSQPVDILLCEGNYFMNKPLILNETYSRTSKNKIRVSGDKNNIPNFYGGNKITPVLDKETGYWVINTNYEKDKFSTGFSQILSINGQPREISKFPLTSFIVPLKVVNDDSSFTITIPAELNEILNTISKENIKNVFATFYIKWTNVIRYIDTHDYKKSTISFKGDKLPDLYLIEPNVTRFTLSNIKNNLGPGQWYYKDYKTILYKPLETDHINNSLVVLAKSKEILIITGNLNNKVSHIEFENIAFNTFGDGLVRNGYFPYQAAVNVESVIQMTYANNVNFKNILAKNISTNVFGIREGCENIKILNSNFSNLGAGAFKIGNVKYNSDNEATSNITIDNNIINKGGVLYPDAVPILILDSHSNTISHNDISDFTYTGISIGWVWGYGKSLAYKNTISYNHIYNLGKGMLDDMGGIYTLGVSNGTIIQNNVIHDIKSKNYGGWGIYADEGSSGILIKNNLVYNCSSSGFHQHYGKENILENNIFAFNSNAELEATKIENHLSFTFSNNIIIHRDNNFFGKNWIGLRKKVNNNIYYSLMNNKDRSSDYLKTESNYHVINPLLEKKNFYYLINNEDIYRLTNFKKIDFLQVGVN